MDTIDRSESNLPARFPVAPSPLPAVAPVFSGDLTVATTPQFNPRALLRGLLIRHGWKILVVWILSTCPVVYLINRYVEPVYEVFSTLQIDPVQRDLLAAPKTDMIEARSVIPYLQTQVGLITSDRVLDRCPY